MTNQQGLIAEACALSAQNERAAFEAWVLTQWPGAPLSHVRDALPKSDPRYGEYCNEHLQRCWVGWQARARQAGCPTDAMLDTMRKAVESAVAAALGDAYDCIRVWDAWSYGTMGPDDFLSVAGDADRVAEISDAAMAAMISASHPAPQHGDLTHCACGDAYPATSYGAGFIDGSGMCPNCDAAIPAKDIHAPAARDVLAERRRQIEAEGMTTAGDDGYHAAELPRAAAAYILNGSNDEAPCIWPWAKAWWKPRDARANYVRAGALILAEIERLDRAALSAQQGEGGEV